MSSTDGNLKQIPVMITGLREIQELHSAKHGERPVYAADDYHAEREPVRWHKYTICTNCHTDYPCATRQLADKALGETS